MIKIKRVSNEDEMYYYTFGIFPDMHNELISFFNDLGFSEDELIKVDTIFSELDGECFHIKKKNMKIHFFICKGNINMVIDSEEPQENLSKLMKKYFLFPQ